MVNEEHGIIVFLDRRPSFVLPGVSGDVCCIYMVYLCVVSRVVIIFCDGCDLFFPFFFEHERHFGMWHVATCWCALVSQFLI
jgi:hypothetical protein